MAGRPPTDSAGRCFSDRRAYLPAFVLTGFRRGRPFFLSSGNRRKKLLEQSGEQGPRLFGMAVFVHKAFVVVSTGTHHDSGVVIHGRVAELPDQDSGTVRVSQGDADGALDDFLQGAEPPGLNLNAAVPRCSLAATRWCSPDGCSLSSQRLWLREKTDSRPVSRGNSRRATWV